MDPATILVVDDDATYRSLLAGELKRRGFVPTAVAGVSAAIEAMGQHGFEVAIVDLKLVDGTGLEVVRHAQQHHPRTEVIMLTGHGTIESAIEAMRGGAFDYLRKPCPFEELEVTLQKALERQALIERNRVLQDGLAPPDVGAGFVGKSQEFLQLRELIEQVAAADTSVLILGETGVGKDVAAKLIHARSARRNQPMVVVECASLQQDLLHSELFGHERGAYTGAVNTKHGLCEVAHGGTLFLDEIGDVSLETQVKLLRVLETGRFRRVGGTRELTVDVRVVAATNRDLLEMVERGLFRKDLFYRMSTIRIEIGPLRQRPADIPVLVNHFLGRFNERFGQSKRITDGALQLLLRHHWPGNVRELHNVVERAVVLSRGDSIEVCHLPPEVTRPEAAAGPLQTLEELECLHIRRVLRTLSGNRSQAARVLGISERTLYRKLKEHDLEGDG